MAESLKQKTVKGVGWSFADNIANQGITFLVGLVLARLITPEEYGLIGIILIFVAVFDSIVNCGFSNALIRKNDADDRECQCKDAVNDQHQHRQNGGDKESGTPTQTGKNRKAQRDH